jgi:beta-N-acetylhexosaminidase
VIKYGGSMLWALMIYWMVSSIRGRWLPIQSALVSSAVALGVELFKLYPAPLLDAFRLTLPGTLLLGRVFSVWNLIAYAFAIGVGALTDRAIRSLLVTE